MALVCANVRNDGRTMNLTRAIRQRAGELGFDAIGITPADELETEGERLREWLHRGYHGTMKWMERDNGRRSDPRHILPGARSIIVLALNYYTPAAHSGESTTGKISRYAWGDDYHRILYEKMRVLLDFIHEADPRARDKAYVDTGPVMEKAWARRAGIGWIGKHTNVITMNLGSWVFLGVIILNLPLEYDAAATDHCGSCTLCIEACPTGALNEPYVLDARRCISYLTIEHRGEIDAALTPNLERWIYGCDICQDVCPWNEKFARPTHAASFHPREGNVAPELAAMSALTQEEFRKRFHNSSLKRTKLSGLLRNIAAVQKSQRSVPPPQQRNSNGQSL